MKLINEVFYFDVEEMEQSVLAGGHSMPRRVSR